VNPAAGLVECVFTNRAVGLPFEEHVEALLFVHALLLGQALDVDTPFVILEEGQFCRHERLQVE